MEKVNIQQKFAAFSGHWEPKLIASLNGQAVKLVKVKGPFIWHLHEEADELFLVLEGRLLLQFRDRDVILEPGELLVVPAGVEHRPVAGPDGDEEVHLLLFEPESVVNTGNVRNAFTVDKPERL